MTALSSSALVLAARFSGECQTSILIICNPMSTGHMRRALTMPIALRQKGRCHHLRHLCLQRQRSATQPVSLKMQRQMTTDSQQTQHRDAQVPPNAGATISVHVVRRRACAGKPTAEARADSETSRSDITNLLERFDSHCRLQSAANNNTKNVSQNLSFSTQATCNGTQSSLASRTRSGIVQVVLSEEVKSLRCRRVKVAAFIVHAGVRHSHSAWMAIT